MTQYCRVENNEVVSGPRTLPKVWANTSHFSAFSDVEKISYGWYPVDITQPDFDPLTQTRTGPVFTILTDQVQAVWTVQERPLAEVKAVLIARLKVETRERIYADGAEDYKQRNAALGLLPQADIDAIIATIDTHRTACTTMEADLLAKTTVQEAVDAYDLWYAS